MFLSKTLYVFHLVNCFVGCTIVFSILRGFLPNFSRIIIKTQPITSHPLSISCRWQEIIIRIKGNGRTSTNTAILETAFKYY